jgi:hypothetical protein
MRFERVSDLIQKINDYGVEKNITWQNRHIYAIMSKSKYCWWRDNNYTEKLVTKKLSQTTYDFSNI